MRARRRILAASLMAGVAIVLAVLAVWLVKGWDLGAFGSIVGILGFAVLLGQLAWAALQPSGHRMKEPESGPTGTGPTTWHLLPSLLKGIRQILNPFLWIALLAAVWLQAFLGQRQVIGNADLRAQEKGCRSGLDGNYRRMLPGTSGVVKAAIATDTGDDTVRGQVAWDLTRARACLIESTGRWSLRQIAKPLSPARVQQLTERDLTMWRSGDSYFVFGSIENLERLDTILPVSQANDIFAIAFVLPGGFPEGRGYSVDFTAKDGAGTYSQTLFLDGQDFQSTDDVR